jgi:hypothetical protein
MAKVSLAVIDGFWLAFGLLVISFGSVTVGLIAGGLLQSLLGIPAAAIGTLILALAIWAIKLLIKVLFSEGNNNPRLTLAIGISPLAMIALVSMVLWVIALPAADMRAVFPALAAVVVTVYSAAAVIIGLRTIRRSGQRGER